MLDVRAFLRLVRQLPALILALATFVLFPGLRDAQREIVWALMHVDGEWKVSDIESRTNDWESRTNDWKLSELGCT